MKSSEIDLECRESLSITPFCADTPIEAPHFDLFHRYVEANINTLLPDQLHHLLIEAQKNNTLNQVIGQFEDQLPIIAFSHEGSAPTFVRFSLLCFADFTHGAGRYFTDMIARWAYPGKATILYSTQSLRFAITGFPNVYFFFYQGISPIETAEDLEAISKNFNILRREIQLNIRSVMHARKIVKTKHLTDTQMKMVIKEQMASLLSREDKDIEKDLLEQMHELLIKAATEEKIDQIKQQLTRALLNKTEPYERDIFNEMQHFVSFFSQSFAAVRQTSHLTRLVSFYYLFRKHLQHEVEAAPDKRHLSVKLFRTSVKEEETELATLGLLIAINLLKEHELFDALHALEAVQHCMPNVEMVPSSYVTDRQNLDKIRLLYFEVKKTDHTPFSLEETNLLRQRLPQELKASVENVVNAVFMPNNDEEIMRNIILLASELKYVDDIPQVIVHFDRQKGQDVIFSVVLLRIIRPNSPPIDDLLARERSIRILEIKEAGTVRKRYAKQACVFHIVMPKKPYLRKNFTLDLFKARQNVISQLEQIFGHIRDYNGGLLAKQHEVYFELHKSLSPDQQAQDYLLENLFYSLSPVINRSTLPLQALRSLFGMTLEVGGHNFSEKRAFFRREEMQGCINVFFAHPDEKERDRLFKKIKKLSIPTANLTYTFIDAYDVPCLGLILRTDQPFLSESSRSSFLQTFQQQS